MFSKMPRDFIFWLLENQEVSIKVLVVRGKKLKKIAIKISIQNYILPWLFSKQLVAHTTPYSKSDSYSPKKLNLFASKKAL